MTNSYILLSIKVPLTIGDALEHAGSLAAEIHELHDYEVTVLNTIPAP